MDRAGVGEKPRLRRTLHFHTLRKFFRTSLELAGVSKSFRERMMGHKGEYLDDSYFKPHLEQMLAEYRKAIPYLTIAKGREKKPPEEQKEEAKRILELAGISPDVVALIKQRKAASDEPEKKKEQQIVEEDKLPNHLSHGWSFVACLGNGKCVVEKT